MINITLLEAMRLHRDKQPIFIKLGRQFMRIKPSDNIRDFLRIANETFWLSGRHSIRFYSNS